MSNPLYFTPRSYSFMDVVLFTLRLLAAGWAAYFAVGYVLQWSDLLRQRAGLCRDGNAIIFPWLYLPFFATAGLSAGFAIWGTKRPDRIGLCVQLAMALEAAYFIALILWDLATNRRPHSPGTTKIIAASMLALFIVGAWRSASLGSPHPWLPAIRTLLSEILLFLAMLIGSGVIEGFQKAWHDKFAGWGSITTPAVLALNVVGTAMTVALVWLTWRMQSNELPQWAARLFAAAAGR